jgi:putative phosphoribosyl transferase
MMDKNMQQKESNILSGNVMLKGWLEIPDRAHGLVVFVHGSGSSRFSKRNNRVAEYLRAGGLGTLLFDLLTVDEDRLDAISREHRFDIPLLTRRLSGAIGWLAEQPDADDLPLGLFGSSTGAAAALVVAALLPDRICAVVSRGGRVDLAGDYLGQVKAPTLLIVGSRDTEVLGLNVEARARLSSAELAVVAHATHLFEEPGALEEVATLARTWFLEKMHSRQEGSGQKPEA